MQTTEICNYLDRFAEMFGEIQSWPPEARVYEALENHRKAIERECGRWRTDIRDRELRDREAEIEVRAERMQAVWHLHSDCAVYLENRKKWEDLLATFEGVVRYIREKLERVPPRVILEAERIERRLNEMHNEIYGWCRTPEMIHAVYEFWYGLECLWDSMPIYDDARDCHEGE